MNSQSLVLWFGHQANQRALANKIHQKTLVKAIVIEQPRQKNVGRKITLQKIIDKIRFHKIDQVWYDLLKNYNQTFPEWPNVPILVVENINNPKVAEWTKKQNPDLLAVSGTRLIKKPVIQTPATYGIINLHTGLSPYIKGGPNCTNWCIADDKMHLIGNTVMWIDEGIDSGKLINTELTKLEPGYSFFVLHKAVMEHAHVIYVNAIVQILNNHGKVMSIAQDEVAKGTTYYTKQWNTKIKMKLLRKLKNLHLELSKAIKKREATKIKTINLQ